MTRLEFLQAALKRIAAAELTHEEAAIMATLTRFNGYLISQMVREMGAAFKKEALSSLGRKGLIIGLRPKGTHRFRYSITDSGRELMQSILGKEVEK